MSIFVKKYVVSKLEASRPKIARHRPKLRHISTDNVSSVDKENQNRSYTLTSKCSYQEINMLVYCLLPIQPKWNAFAWSSTIICPSTILGYNFVLCKADTAYVIISRHTTSFVTIPSQLWTPLAPKLRIFWQRWKQPIFICPTGNLLLKYCHVALKHPVSRSLFVYSFVHVLDV